MNTAKTAIAIQKIENAGVTLKVKGDFLNYKSPSLLSDKQLHFLKENKLAIIQYLNYRESANEETLREGEKIERPDDTEKFEAKKFLLFYWLCRQQDLNPDNWDSFDTEKQYELSFATQATHHTLLTSQCKQCKLNTGRFGCSDMAGFQIICLKWDTRLVDWAQSCPLRPRKKKESIMKETFAQADKFLT